MKYIQWGLLFCCCDVLLASNIDKSIDLVNEFNREKGVDCPTAECSQNAGMASSLTNAQECALSLCGSPENQKKYYITDENFDKLVSPDAINKYSQIEHKIKDIVDNDIRNIRAFLEALKKFTNGEGDNFRDWSRDDYKTIAPLAYTPYMAIEISSNSVKLVAQPPTDADEDFLKGLKSYVTNASIKWEGDDTGILCGGLCAKGVQSYLRVGRVKRMAEELEAEINKPSFARLSMASCKSLFGLLSEKNTRVKISLRMVRNAKARVLDRVNKSFSSRTYQSFKKHLNAQVGFAWERSFRESPDFRDFFDSINKIHGEMPEKTAKYDKQNFHALAGRMISIFFDGETVRSTSGLCPDMFTMKTKLPFTDEFFFYRVGFLGSLIPDAFAIEKIRVSPGSLADPERGEEIVAHEIAHAFSHAFKLRKLSRKSKRKYLGLRKCATSAYLNKSNQKIFHPLRHRGDGIYTEEDVADIIAWSSYPKGGSLSMCSALGTDKNFSNYTGLSMFNLSPEPMHSSRFLRVIMEAVYKDIPLPSSCKKFLHAHSNFYKVKKCSVE